MRKKIKYTEGDVLKAILKRQHANSPKEEVGGLPWDEFQRQVFPGVNWSEYFCDRMGISKKEMKTYDEKEFKNRVNEIYPQIPPMLRKAEEDDRKRECN